MSEASRYPSTSPRVRRDIQSLLADGESGRKVIDDYARGIQAMRDLDTGTGDPTDPRSWRFQAAIHGFPGLAPSNTHPQHWGSCRHNSWFFLLWHRAYLYFFEQIVQSHLGDDSWSLPYWDYTKTGDESSRLLPEPFRTPTSGNPLHTSERDPDVNGESDPTPIPPEWTEAVTALSLSEFTVAGADPRTSFAGGKVDDVAPNMGARGSLEGIPHGLVHVAVGGDTGWMSAFETAGLDPIFWLHHCNLDRLIDVWIGLYGADALPPDSAWRDTSFELFDGDGTRRSLSIGAMLVTSELGYEYESTDPPEGVPAPPAREALAPMTADEGARPTPELLGATSDVPMSGRRTVGIELAESGARLAADAGPSRWYLRVEDIVGGHPATPGYAVYMNVPEGERAADHPERRAGTVASFGIPEASRRDAEHGGAGLTDVFDVTDLVSRLRETEGWDAASVSVTIVPVGLKGEADDGGDVRAGRISVYAG